MKFPSPEWCEAAAAAMLGDPLVIPAVADFGAVAAGIVIVRDAGLSDDFCILAHIEPGRNARLMYPEDEDELEDYGPDYIAWAPYTFCRALLEQAFAGDPPDPLRLILERKIRIRGDLERLVKHMGRHRAAGLDALRAIPTEFV